MAAKKKHVLVDKQLSQMGWFSKDWKYKCRCGFETERSGGYGVCKEQFDAHKAEMLAKGEA